MNALVLVRKCVYFMWKTEIRQDTQKSRDKVNYLLKGEPSGVNT